jgi:hypothetical protein
VETDQAQKAILYPQGEAQKADHPIPDLHIPQVADHPTAADHQVMNPEVQAHQVAQVHQ